MKFTEATLAVRELVVISYILTLVLSIVGLFVAVRLCKKRLVVALSSAAFALSFIVVFLTMRGSFRYRVGKSVFEPSLTVINLPLWLHISVAAILFTLGVFSLVYSALWNRKNLSPVSIKESVDKLPAGICFYEENGLIRLVNDEMNGISVAATGKALLNGVEFFAKISSGETEENCVSLKTGDEPVLRLPNDKIVNFRKYAHKIGDKTVFEIVATDITKEYGLAEEAERKLEELKKINERLIAYGENVTELTREKEILAAKIRIHDDMGKLLLLTRRKLDEPLTSGEKTELAGFWQAEIAAMKSPVRKPRKSDIQIIEETAKLIGVSLIFEGEKPKKDSVNEKILAAALRECLTNAVSHADGKTLTTKIENSGDYYVFKITNDGRKPDGEIVEGGGLSGLRTLVSREGGEMVVKSKPQFELTIKLRQGKQL